MSLNPLNHRVSSPRLSLTRRGLAATFLSLALAVPFVSATDHSHRATYKVTITNITKGQVFSPPLLVTHRPSIQLFTAGEESSGPLAAIAEDGNTEPLATLLETVPEALDVVTVDGPIPPGKSATVYISSKSRYAQLSIAGMLVNTNDAFFALRGERLPKYRGAKRSVRAIAYDAGSEANNENCGFIPGPACPAGSGNARDVDDAEGFVHVHNGVHGIADLAPDAYDWRNPVALIQIKRVR